MKTYLVEDLSSDIEFDDGSLIIALTPNVCYRLDKEGIEYSIIEDYYNEAELSNQVEDYGQSVSQWIDELDEFFQNNIKQLSLKLGTIYKWYLKVNVLDPLYIRCYTLKKLFESVKPSEVTYISHKPDEPHLNDHFEHYGRSLYSQVIPILCDENNIPLTSIFLEPDSEEIRETKTTSREISLARLRGILGKSGVVWRLYFIFEYIRNRSFAKRAKRRKLNILMLKVSSIGVNFMVGALGKGHNLCLLSGDSILKYSCLGARKHIDLKAQYDRVTGLNNNLWEHAADLLEGHDLIKWVNEKCQLDVSEVVLPRLRHFVSKVCPEIVGYFKVFTEFYEKDEIDILFTSHAGPPIEYAALAAANYHRHIRTACLVHGDAVYDSRTWNMLELQNFDIHISSNTEVKEYFRCLAEATGSSAKLYSSPHRLLNMQKIGYLREKRRRTANRKERIIYQTTFMKWDTRKMEGTHYPDTWYYKLQESLIEYFSTRKEFIFVWKGLPASEVIYNPIPDFIRDNNFSNIEVATNPFTEHLLSVDRVICDYPSTGFYESVVAGVPTMSLCHRALIFREPAVDYFGNLLKFYSDIPEAIKYIGEFLYSDPELYRTTIEMEDKGVLHILEENVIDSA